MSAMFAKLKVVRDTFHAIRTTLGAAPVGSVDADTASALLGNMAALDTAIEELDDAMVADKRAEQYARTLPTPTDFTTEYLALLAGSATTAEICS